MPEYLGFGIGSEGFSLSLKRIFLIILFMSSALLFTQKSNHMLKQVSQVYQQNRLLINALLLFFVIKIISLSLNSRELSQYMMLFNDFLLSIFIFLLTTILIDSEDGICHLVKVIFYSYTFVLVLVLIDYILQFPVYSTLASNQMMLTRDVSEVFVRGEKIRVQASFYSPIQLGSYLVVLFPLIISYINRKKYSLIFEIIYILFFIFAIYSTGSRSAILMSAVLIYLYVILHLYNHGRFYRLIANLFNLIIAAIVLYIAFIYISDLIASFTGRFDIITDEEKRSSVSRALQYIRVYDKMSEAPFFGFGRVRNFTDLLGSAIDNYYFWTILEVGIIGIFFYILFLFLVVKTAFKLYKVDYETYYLLPIFISILLIIFYQMLSATPENHIYLYIFAGLISKIKVWYHNNRI